MNGGGQPANQEIELDLPLVESLEHLDMSNLQCAIEENILEDVVEHLRQVLCEILEKTKGGRERPTRWTLLSLEAEKQAASGREGVKLKMARLVRAFYTTLEMDRALEVHGMHNKHMGIVEGLKLAHYDD